MGELNQECVCGDREVAFSRCLPGMFTRQCSARDQQRALVDTHTNFVRATDSIAIDFYNGSLIQGKLAFRELPK